MTGSSGKYRLETRLGGGGMAEVFLGEMLGAEGFSRQVAIKRVLAGFSDNPSFAQMFVAEAQLSSRLHHPNIVSVLDFDRDADGRLFLVMELVDGKDLESLCASGLLPHPVAIFIISEVLRGLGHAHDLPSGNSLRGVVHRDVSPHNVLLSWQGAVKVSDFGIAKARQASEATASLFIKGKPAYMSPEQANGQPLDGRSDLFAVGVMLWEMLTGRRLFVGADTRATLAAVLFGQIPRPRSVRSDVPKDLERVAMKLLERDLPARHATADQALHALLACRDAPKDGREQLVRLLSERFPRHAPVRDSGSWSTDVDEPTTLPAFPSYATTQPATTQDLRRPPAPPLSSLGAYRNTATGTMHAPMATVRPPRRRGTKLAVVVGAMLAAVLVSVAIVAMTGQRGSLPTPDASAPSADAAVATAVAVDAALVTPVDAAPAPEPPKKGAIASQPVEKRMGRLVVRAFPVLTVYVDNKRIHDTPVDLKLLVGKHRVRLVNSDVGKNEVITVTIEANKTAIIERN